MKRQKGRIITITSTKGGVGKTITTLNLAAIYHKLGKKVLVMDLDIYGGSVATYVDSKNEHTIFNFVDDITNNRYKDINDYLYNYNENISILAAPKDPRQANKIEPKYINIILSNVVNHFDVILIDTTHILNDINVVTLDSSDSILYVFTNDVFDLKNTKSFVSIVKDTNMKNLYTVLNNSIGLDKNYFSNYDIRNIIDTNIDFTISKSLYVRNIDKYIMQGEILLLNKALMLKDKNDYKKLVDMANKLLEDKEGE